MQIVGNRLPAAALGVAIAGLPLALISGCASNTPTTAAIHATCQEISAVLSDGPDRTVDPVGYAEAQIDPLRQIRTEDRSLKGAIDRLATAYQEFFEESGGRIAERAVNQASRAVNAICPDAAS